ncbi:MAG: YIP1 family protein [bacterium]
MSEPTISTEETAAETVVVNPFSRIISIITEPSAAMRGAIQKPAQWWVPLVLTLIGVIIFAILAGDVVRDFSVQKMQERFTQMVADGRLSQERADQIFEQQSQGGLMTIGIYVGPMVNIFIFNIIFSLFALLVGNVILGGNLKFGHYWTIIWWSSVIGFISFVISAILMNITGDIHGAQLGLGIITKANPDSTAHKILQVFDVFRIWQAIVAGIGVAIAAKVSSSKGIVWMLVVFLGISLIMSLAFGNAM